jgi:hypothetical protein
MAPRRASRFIAIVALALLSCPALGQGDVRVAVAKSTSSAGTFTARPANGNQFRALPENADLYTGDILVCLPGASLASKNGAVALKSLADYDDRAPLPILETAIVLADSKQAQLDLTLDRGRIDLTNAKESGAATVRVRFWEQTWSIVLDSPGTRVAMELSARWPAGSRFRLADKDGDPSKAPAPAASLVFWLLKGTASVDVGGVTLALKAPPGPAQLIWNSLTGARPQPLRLDKVPDWADPNVPVGDQVKKTADAVEKFRKARVDEPGKAIERFLDSSNPVEQRVALVTLGAIDDLDTLGKALAGAKTLEQWDFGITVLRHWLGRCRGQDQRYYEILTTVRGYSATQARTIMQLLFGFSADDVSRPETYEVLIDYLGHEKPAIRHLAAWHLVRLVPQGKSIPYKPDGTPSDAEATQAAWKRLIPSGELPPPVKKE